jgi:hypothetical protein
MQKGDYSGRQEPEYRGQNKGEPFSQAILSREFLLLISGNLSHQEKS